MAESVAESVEAPREQAVEQEEAREVRGRGHGRAEPPPQRQQVELHGEEELEHDREPERGDRHAADSEEAQSVVEPRVVADGGQHAERDAEAGAEEERGERQLERRRQPLEDVPGDRAPGLDAGAEVSLDDLPQVDPELDDQRLVEPVLGADLDDLLGRGILAGQGGRGIVGHDADQDERQHEEPEQDGQDEQDPPQEESQHDRAAGAGAGPAPALPPASVGQEHVAQLAAAAHG